MTTPLIYFLLSESVLIAVIIGLIRIKRLDKNYYTFYATLVLAAIDELISYVVESKFGNAIVINIYSLLECYLLLCQLYIWRKSKRMFQLLIVLMITCTLIWIIQNLVYNKINTFNPFFLLFYAFVVVLLSINQINAIVLRPEGALIKNPKFIICIGFVTFYVYLIIFQVSSYNSKKTTEHDSIFIGFTYINLIINFLYAYAIYLITSKSNHESLFKKGLKTYNF